MIVILRMTNFITITNFHLTLKTLTTVRDQLKIFLGWYGTRESPAYEQRHVFAQGEMCVSVKQKMR